MKISRNGPCPCGQPSKYKRCCGRLHRGTRAPSAEALMRSRYSAYAVADVGYILETTHPDSPHAMADRSRWAREVEVFCRTTDFIKLDVLGTGSGGPDEDWVTFRATLMAGGRDVSFVERSVFRRVAGVWLYLSGTHEA